MECEEARELVSAALDGEHVDAVLLAAAKDHCTACPDCAAWVHALVRVQAATAPVPPADLPDRIMARIHQIEAANAPVKAGVPEAADDIPDDIAAAFALPAAAQRRATTTETLGFERFIKHLLDPERRLPNLMWAATAVTGLVCIAVVFSVSLRMSALRSIGQTGERAVVLDTYGTPTPETATEGLSLEKTAPTGEFADVAPSSALIVLNGIVYRAAGVDMAIARANLSVVGNTTTSLDGNESRDRTVLGTRDLSRVYIESDAGGLLAFTRITRTYQDKTYALNSGPITSYGQEPTLPSSFVAPTGADGSPTFQADTADPNVFVLIGRTAAEGIALAPGADSSASGWTWWTPVQ